MSFAIAAREQTLAKAERIVSPTTSRYDQIAIAEEQSLVREGLKCLLEKIVDIKVVGEAADGLDAIKVAQKERPDILLLGLDLPRVHGIEVIRRLRAEGKATQTVVVTMHSDAPQVSEALRAGASGYVLTTDTPADLNQAIRLAVAGDHYISAQVKKGSHLRDIRQGTKQ